MLQAVGDRMNTHDLVCPRCPAANRPGVSYIILHPNKRTAECIVCAHSGLVAEFMQKEK